MLLSGRWTALLKLQVLLLPAFLSFSLSLLNHCAAESWKDRETPTPPPPLSLSTPSTPLYPFVWPCRETLFWSFSTWINSNRSDAAAHDKDHYSSTLIDVCNRQHSYALHTHTYTLHSGGVTAINTQPLQWEQQQEQQEQQIWPHNKLQVSLKTNANIIILY